MSHGKIYFLVNNNYQYLEAERLARELREAGYLTALIEIPHTLSMKPDLALFDPIIKFNTPARMPWRSAWPRYLMAKRRLDIDLRATAEDTLLLFTEFELLNQLVAIIFKERGSSVYLIEDGGVGTYIPISLRQREPYSLKNLVMQASIRVIPGLMDTHFTKFDGVLFPMLDDKYLDGMLMYRQVKAKRQVPVTIISRPVLPQVKILKGRVIFLNQPLYSEYIQSENDYSAGLRQILNALCEGFNDVLFKFHPREPESARSRIKSQIIDDFPSVKIIDGNQPLEIMLTDLRPEVIASYNSTPLFNLTGTGVQPLFVFHLLPDLCRAPSFDTMYWLLDSWGYRFVKNWSELASGYCSGSFSCFSNDATHLAKFLDRTNRIS